MKKYVCNVCGYVYDPEVGDPDSGIAPGTAFEDIPEDWVCPICGVTKEDFTEEELSGTLVPQSDYIFRLAYRNILSQPNDTRKAPTWLFSRVMRS